MFKNVASQSIALFAFDATTGLPKTGDAANMVFYVTKDWGSVTAISSNSGVPTEVDSTNAKGWYKIALSQTETSADELLITGKSSTANIVVCGTLIATDPANYTAFSLDGSGRVDAIKINSVSTSSVTTINANLGTMQPVNFTGTAGSALVKGDAIDINSVAASSVTTINANIGTTQPINFTGTAGSALVKSDMVDVAGSAVSTSSAQIGVNVVNYNAQTAQTDANNLPKVDIEAINAVTLAAQALGKSTQSICWGTCSGGTTATAVVSTLNNPSSLTDSGQLIGRTIIFLGNTTTTNQQSQASNITASTTGATPTITFTAMTHAPANGDVFVVL